MSVIKNKDNIETVYCIKKEKLTILDFVFAGSGFDLRVSFSRETPSRKFAREKSTYKRIKKRTSYIYKHLSFDLTTVIMEDNKVEDHLFEVELEIKDISKILNKTMTSHYLVHDSLLKIRDIIKFCDEIDNSAKLQFVKEKNYEE